MGRLPVIAGNWKMHKTSSEAVRFSRELVGAFGKVKKTGIIIAPPFVHLHAVSQEIGGSNIALGAQNVSEHDEGAFTGEVSGPMLVDVGCRYVIVGHSERRHIYGETDAMVNRKISAALRHGLDPILCVGKTLDEREADRTDEVVTGQLSKGLAGLTETDLGRMLVAYEPVWAIGTGRTATPDQAQEVHGKIRALVAGKFGRAAAENLRVLYGGSVKPDNITGLLVMDDIDGALVGGACLKVASFSSIVFAAEEECANI